MVLDTNKDGQEIESGTVNDGTNQNPDITPETGTENASGAETETVPDGSIDPYIEEFNQLGLGSIYNDPIEAMRQLKEKDRYIAQIHQRNAELNRQLQERTQNPRPEYNSDNFLENPIKTMREQGFVTGDEIDARVNNSIDSWRIKQFFNNTPDFAKYAPAIDNILTQNPWMLNVPSRADVLELAYRHAKALSGTVKTQPVKPADQEKKDRATTVDSNNKKPRPGGQTKDKYGLTQEDYKKLPLAEIERRVGRIDE